MAFPLTQEQRSVVEHRRDELLVSAAAGSGKTRVLVERLLDRVIREEVDIDRFLVITFTRAAAAELRDRVARELNDRLAGAPGDPWLRRQVALVYKAPISTIHSLCGDLLREFGHGIDLDPDFRLLDEGEARLLRDGVLEDVVEKRYESIVPGDDFSQLLDQFSAGRDDARLLRITEAVYWRLQAHPAPMVWLDEMERLWDLPEGALPEDTLWGRTLLAELADTARFWEKELLRARALCEGNSGLKQNYGPSLADGARQFALLAAAAAEGWDAVRQCRGGGFLTAGRKKTEKTPEVEWVKQIRAEAKKELEKIGLRFAQSGGEVVEDLRAVAPAVRGLFALIRDFDRGLQAEKKRKNVLDFNDLEHRTVELLGHEETARTLSERFVEVMVDEYQDTNAVQNTIFNALTGGGETLFQVGDVKQSIYRFRMADPTIFLEKYARFGEAEGGPRRIALSTNFRSRPQVLGAVNDLFRAVMSPELGELEYAEDQQLRPGRQFPAPEGAEWNTELDVLLTGQPEEEESDGAVPKDLQEARFVAGRLKELILSGFRVTDGEELRPVRPGDMAVLLRSPGAVKHHYARAFREAGLSWQSEGSENLLESLEVQVTLALLQVVDNPRQDVPLIAALRSPVWSMSADRLAELRAACPDTDFYTALRAGADRGEEDCLRFLTELERLRLEAADRPAHELLWQLYQEYDVVGIFSAMDGGADRRSNLMHLYECARTFEQTGHKGLYRFLRYLRRLQERGQLLPGAPAGKTGDAVTLLSIHRSKGLEFPVVMVAGLNRRFNRTDLYAPMLFHPGLGVGPQRLNGERHLEYPTLARLAITRELDRELLAEEMRLLYVAMTRAKDKLMLCCTLTDGGKKLESLVPWVENPAQPVRLSSCASAGEWILLHALSRPDAGELHRAAGVCCAVGRPLESTWNIRLCQPDGEEDRRVSGTAQSGGTALPEGITEGYGWSYPHQAAADTPSKLTATQLKGRAVDAEAAEAAPALPRPPVFRRPRFLQQQGLTAAERGTAIHLAMQFLDFARTGAPEQIEEELERLEREKFLTPEQRACVPPEKILAFFQSELGQELLASPCLKREFKFSLLSDAREYYPEVGEGEQVLLQGVIDCWFENRDGSLTVVDFKTDARPEPGNYRPQVTAYAGALERITGRPVTRKVLYFFADNSTRLV